MDSERVRTYSAAQLLAKIKNDDWIGSIQAKVDRELQILPSQSLSLSYLKPKHQEIPPCDDQASPHAAEEMIGRPAWLF